MQKAPNAVAFEGNQTKKHKTKIPNALAFGIF